MLDYGYDGEDSLVVVNSMCISQLTQISDGGRRGEDGKMREEGEGQRIFCISLSYRIQ